MFKSIAMKIIPGVFVFSALLMNACNPAPSKQPASDAATVKETPATPAASEKPVKEITGKVKEVVNGKDGYTAKVVSEDGKVYSATVSHANLKDPSQYKTVKAGDQVTVKGDSWMMGEEEQITVRELR